MPLHFADVFGREPAVRTSAPGRVNVIGEHTDYNDGFVLPTLIPQRTEVQLAPRAGATVRVVSDARGETEPATFVLGAERRGCGWLDYVQGITTALQTAGHRLSGFDAAIASTVPIGRGLASSAALEVALLRALRDTYGLALDDAALARIGQTAESRFVGARVGIMDQMAASLCRPGAALFLDTRSFAYEHVPLPADVDLVVVDSGVRHDHASGGYNARRAECERACGLLGLASLRDVAPADLDRLGSLPPLLVARVRHVVSENARVLDAVAALRRGDVTTLGALLVASHASLRDDYAVSVPEVDTLVALALEDADVHGARLTGGGFGGAVVILARAGTGAAVGARVARAYGARSGRNGAVVVPPVDPVATAW